MEGWFHLPPSESFRALLSEAVFGFHIKTVSNKYKSISLLSSRVKLPQVEGLDNPSILLNRKVGSQLKGPPRNQAVKDFFSVRILRILGELIEIGGEQEGRKRF